MKVYIVQTVARQINGEFILVKVEKAFTQREQADAFVKDLAKKTIENIPTQSGLIECLCERGVFEAEVE